MRRLWIPFFLVATVAPARAGVPPADSRPLVPAGPEPQASILYLGTTGGAIEPCL